MKRPAPGSYEKNTSKEILEKGNGKSKTEKPTPSCTKWKVQSH